MTQVDFYDKEQVDDLLAAKADDSEVESIAADVGTSADDPSATGSIWARLKYILTHWMTTDSAQTVSAKKTFSISPEVPTTPATPTSAINSVYANDATSGVNNIVHKSGNEIISGGKYFVNQISRNISDFTLSDIPTTTTYANVLMINDESYNQLCRIGLSKDTTGKFKLYVDIRNSDGTWRYGVTIAESGS